MIGCVRPLAARVFHVCCLHASSGALQVSESCISRCAHAYVGLFETQVERVVSQSQMEQDEGEEPVTKYLVKWEGLPYAECTWETMEDINQAGEETMEVV